MPPEPLTRAGSPGLHGRSRDSQPRDPRRPLRRKSADATDLATIMGHGMNGFSPQHTDVESPNGKRGHIGGNGVWRVSATLYPMLLGLCSDAQAAQARMSHTIAL